jgi:hypothetical protein
VKYLLIPILFIILSNYSYSFDPNSCNLQLFDEEKPELLSKFWAQEMVGTAIFTRDHLITDKEMENELTYSAAESMIEKFYLAHGDNIVFESEKSKKYRIDPGKYNGHGDAGISFLGTHNNKSTIAPTKNTTIYASINMNISDIAYDSGSFARGKINFVASGNNFKNPRCTSEVEGRSRNYTLKKSNIFVSSLGPNGIASSFSDPSFSNSFITAPADFLITTHHDTLFGGTSAAAPVAAGVAGWLVKVLPDFDEDTLINIVLSSAIDVEGKSYDCRTGWGMISAPRIIKVGRLVKEGKIKLTESIRQNQYIIQEFLDNEKVNYKVNYKEKLKEINNCKDYLNLVRNIFFNYHYRPYDLDSKNNLKDFYLVHNLEVNATAYDTNKENEVELYRDIVFNESAPIKLRSHALLSLALQRLTDSYENEELSRITNKELKFLIKNSNNFEIELISRLINVYYRIDIPRAEWRNHHFKELYDLLNLTIKFESEFSYDNIEKTVSIAPQTVDYFDNFIFNFSKELPKEIINKRIAKRFYNKCIEENPTKAIYCKEYFNHYMNENNSFPFLEKPYIYQDLKK